VPARRSGYQRPVVRTGAERPRDDSTLRRARLDQPGLGRRENDWRFHRSRSSHVLHRLGTWSAQAWAGVTIAAILLAWGVVGLVEGFPHWWEVALYSVTSAVTVVMLFAIQHTQHREQVVIQRKLDEILRAEPDADNRMIAAETADDTELRELIQMGPDDPRTDALGAALDRDDRT
jgi:low affinity Fe/Cu permease